MTDKPRVGPKRTKAQLAWCKAYKHHTGFEPTLDTEKPFEEFVWANIRWFEQWSQDVLLRLAKDMPDETN